MVKYIITLVVILNSALVLAQGAEFSFEEKTFKFSKTPEGEVLKHDYHFTNTGDAPLIIQEIKVACTCTKFEYPKEPIKPGGKGVIKVSFDTKDKIGWQNRILEIYSNATPSPQNIRFKVAVDNKHPKQ